MGEEKKVEEEKKEKEKKPEEEKKEKDEKPGTTNEEKPKGGEEKPTTEDNKDSKEQQPLPPPPAPPPPPPPEIILRVYMHCEGCARKVRRCLKSFEVTTDCKTQKVVVKGEKADPLKVLDRVQKKTHRQVELLSPIPKPPPPEEDKKPEEKDPPKLQVKKEEPKVITVVLKVPMHCEPCSLEIKRRIERMKEVEEAIPDLKSSQVTVKGTFEAPKLVEYVYKRTGKRATIVKQDPPREHKDDDKGKDENKGEGEEGKKSEDKKDEAGAGGGEGDGAKATDEGGVATSEEGGKVVEVIRNEYQYYPPKYGVEMHAYPPQIFSDENPNACSIM